MIAIGDLNSILRRLLVIAYEDIGLANPQTANRTLTAITAAERLGLPEARIPLANAVIDLCLAPKSNSAIAAIDAAIADVQAGRSGAIPDALKDAHYKGAAKLGHGVDYKFPHDFPGDWVAQDYLPENMRRVHYYEPKTTGKYEAALSKQLATLQQMKAQAMRQHKP